MKTRIITTVAACSLLALSACTSNRDVFDASGTFEAIETIVSAEAAGRLEQFDVTEGQHVQAGQLLGIIDTTQLAMRREQLQAQIDAVLSKRPNVAAQLAALQEQLRVAIREHDRVKRLREADAATPKQLDDVSAQVDVLHKQIDALRSSLGVTTQGLESETRPLVAQIGQIDDQLSRCRILAPMSGTVLTSYAERFEMTAPGKPLFKMADISTMTLRAYITGAQFSKIKLRQAVTVHVDNGPDSYRTYTGVVTWISDKAEFTPKTIQTTDERANLVYAVKINVPNDGTLKIGMYGEVTF